MSQGNSTLTAKTALQWSLDEEPELRRLVSSFRPPSTGQDVEYLPNSPEDAFDLLVWGSEHLVTMPDDNLHRSESNLSSLAKTWKIDSMEEQERGEMCLAMAVLRDLSVIVKHIRSELGMDGSSDGGSSSGGLCVQAIPLHPDSPAPRPQPDTDLDDVGKLNLCDRVENLDLEDSSVSRAQTSV